MRLKFNFLKLRSRSFLDFSPSRSKPKIFQNQPPQALTPDNTHTQSQKTLPLTLTLPLKLYNPSVRIYTPFLKRLESNKGVWVCIYFTFCYKGVREFLRSGCVFILQKSVIRDVEWGRAFKKCPRFKNQVLSCHGICKKVSV